MDFFDKRRFFLNQGTRKTRSIQLPYGDAFKKIKGYNPLTEEQRDQLKDQVKKNRINLYFKTNLFFVF